MTCYVGYVLLRLRQVDICLVVAIRVSYGRYAVLRGYHAGAHRARVDHIDRGVRTVIDTRYYQVYLFLIAAEQCVYR